MHNSGKLIIISNKMYRCFYVSIQINAKDPHGNRNMCIKCYQCMFTQTASLSAYYAYSIRKPCVLIYMTTVCFERSISYEVGIYTTVLPNLLTFTSDVKNCISNATVIITSTLVTVLKVLKIIVLQHSLVRNPYTLAC